jgi:hypothetical protein
MAGEAGCTQVSCHEAEKPGGKVELAPFTLLWMSLPCSIHGKLVELSVSYQGSKLRRDI